MRALLIAILALLFVSAIHTQKAFPFPTEDGAIVYAPLWREQIGVQSRRFKV